MSPTDFVPVAAAVGLIEPIGEWVVMRACHDVARWPGELRLAVNVSPTQFARGDLVGAVRRALSASGLAPKRLDIEITESVFIEDRGIAQRIIAELHAMGVGCALDDFGIGYSSLAYLRKFAIDKVKLDRTFIGGIPTDHEAVAIVRAVGAMARSLGIMLLAEGVEHQEQVAFLRLLGFSEGQGYLFGKAMREPDMLALLNAPVPAAEPAAPGEARKGA
jgi:EAL domain-containing protein (putative c-di-GMP-specific phosphodiesterase class I)